MRRLFLFALAICGFVWGNVPAKADLLVNVTVATDTMTVRLDQRLIYSGRVATARPGYVTQKGTFRPGAMYEHHQSNLYHIWSERLKKWVGAPMNNATYFWGAEAIHSGSPDAPSHGCVHSPWAKQLQLLIKKEGRDRTLIVIQ